MSIGETIAMDDLDSTIEVLETYEAREKGTETQAASVGKVPIGIIEHYFEKIGVAAIKLEGTLKVGDIIEVGTEEEAVRQRISSMQINREDVSEASEGESIGVKLKHPVDEGSSVYRIGQ